MSAAIGKGTGLFSHSCARFFWRERELISQESGLLYLVKRHVTRYNPVVIKSFADKETEALFCGGSSKKLPPEAVRRALRKMDMLDAAYRVDDLRVPPGNRLHALKGNREGFYAIFVNDQWRLCFRFEGEDAYDVQICDYH